MALANGDVLAVRGVEHSGRTELYDPSAGTWAKGPDLPPLSNQWTAVALAEGGALVLGEAPCTSEPLRCIPTDSTYRLSANDLEFSPAAPMREARVKPVAVRLTDGRVLVAGGFGTECVETIANGFSCEPLASAEIYDPASDEWAPTTPMPQANGGAAATLLSDGTVLAVGGSAQDSIRYDPSTGTWSTVASTAGSRTGALLLALPGDRALAAGSQPEAGFFGSFGGAAARERLICSPSRSETFDAADDTWTMPLPTAVGSENCVHPTGALLSGGQILLDSERDYPQSSPPSPLAVLDPEQRCWSTTAFPLEPRNEGVIVPLPSGSALVFGGDDAEQHALSSSEIYIPGSPGCTPNVTPLAPVNPITTLFRPPRFTGAMIILRGRLALTSSGSIRLLVRCPGSALGRCVGHVQLALSPASSTNARVRGHAKQMPLGEASFSILAGKTAVVTVHLAKHRRVLYSVIRRWRRATILFTATAHDNTDLLATTATTGTLH